MRCFYVYDNVVIVTALWRDIARRRIYPHGRGSPVTGPESVWSWFNFWRGGPGGPCIEVAISSWPGGGGSESKLPPRGGPRKGHWRTACWGRGSIPERVWQNGKCPVDVASEEGGMVRVSDT